MSERNSYFSEKIVTVSVATLLIALANISSAAELSIGEVIDASNLQNLKSQTFEGHRIESMIPESMELLIMDYGLSLTLRESEKIPVNAKDSIATGKYANSVVYHPETNEVTGYTAGLPFPDVDIEGDPDAGHKLMYNYYYKGTAGQSFDGNFTFLFVDPERGITRTQEWYSASFKMKGWLGEEPIIGTQNVVSKQTVIATAPYDVAGVGVFTKRQDGPEMEENWAYLRSVRRIRQLTGGSWMDTLAGSVQLNDEYDMLSARPSWYPEAKVLGKRWILAVAHLELPVVDESKKGTPQEYPTVDTEHAPYWNPIAKWEPREVYVIEVTMPEEHPYSKRILYMEVDFPRFYLGEHYDKSGQQTKVNMVLSTPTRGEDGYIGMLPWQGHQFEFQREEGFVYLGHSDVTINRKSLAPEDVDIGALTKSTR